METTEKNNILDRKIFFNYNFWEIIIFFIVYSILGFILETIFGVLTKGVLESRKSMLYGPFCLIYGLGAIFLICVPNKIKKKNLLLFLYGMIMGSAVEYIVSWVGECIFYIKWWDYSELPLNINGRICLIYTIFWGLCTLMLNNFFNPTISKYVERLEKKISSKTLHIILTITIVLLIADNLTSSFALKMFFTRTIYNYKIENVVGVDTYYDKYLDLYHNNHAIRKIVDTFFSDKTMILAFPNIQITLKDGEIIMMRDIYKDIQPYYIELFKPKHSILVNGKKEE